MPTYPSSAVDSLECHADLTWLTTDLKTEFSPSPRAASITGSPSSASTIDNDLQWSPMATPPEVSAPPTIAESGVTRDESLQPPPEPRPPDAFVNDHHGDCESDLQVPNVSEHATMPEPGASSSSSNSHSADQSVDINAPHFRIPRKDPWPPPDSPG